MSKTIIVLGSNGLIGQKIFLRAKETHKHVLSVDQCNSDINFDANKVSIAEVLDNIDKNKTLSIINCIGHNPKWEDKAEVNDIFNDECWKQHNQLNLQVPYEILQWSHKNIKRYDYLDLVFIGSMYTELSPNPQLYAHGEGQKHKDLGYVSSKHGLSGLIKAFNAASAPNCRATIINPGAVQSPNMTSANREHFEKIWNATVNQPNELADFICDYIFSYKSLFTGQPINVSGGAIK